MTFMLISDWYQDDFTMKVNDAMEKGYRILNCGSEDRNKNWWAMMIKDSPE